MINLYNILKNAPYGITLYTPLWGPVRFSYVAIDTHNIYILAGTNTEFVFNEFGQFNCRKDVACSLFPSMEVRNWKNWQEILFPQSIGSIIKLKHRNESYKIINEHSVVCLENSIVFSLPYFFKLATYTHEDLFV